MELHTVITHWHVITHRQYKSTCDITSFLTHRPALNWESPKSKVFLFDCHPPHFSPSARAQAQRLYQLQCQPVSATTRISNVQSANVKDSIFSMVSGTLQVSCCTSYHVPARD